MVLFVVDSTRVCCATGDIHEPFITLITRQSILDNIELYDMASGQLHSCSNVHAKKWILSRTSIHRIFQYVPDEGTD